MSYLYYPGCSLTATAKEYDLSTRAVMAAAGVSLTDIEGWTCCGASAAAPISHLLSLSLSARNLALAEQADDQSQLLVPCSACYLNLKKARDALQNDAKQRVTINEALSAVDLAATGSVLVRHLLDVLATDLGAVKLSTLIHKPFEGLTVAPYYGCQCLRPYVEFDDPEQPVTMGPLIEATGASVLKWEMGARCCGASLVSTQPETGLKRVSSILQAAKGADLIVTVCPMCQINLDGWQSKASQMVGENLSITVLYLPQLLGFAMGIEEKALGMDLNLALLDGFREKMRE